MSVAANLLWVALWLTLVLVAAKTARRIWPLQQELSRKLVHIGAGLAVPLAWVLQIPRHWALPAAGLATLIALINHRFRLVPEVEDVGRRSIGTIAYGLSITLLVWLWWPQRADLVSACVLVMVLGDGAAGLLGSSFSSPRWQVMGQTKSLIGTSVMAIVSLLVLCLLLRDLSWPTMIALSAAATLLEQISWGGLDNFSVPMGLAAMAYWLGA